MKSLYFNYSPLRAPPSSAQALLPALCLYSLPEVLKGLWSVTIESGSPTCKAFAVPLWVISSVPEIFILWTDDSFSYQTAQTLIIPPPSRSPVLVVGWHISRPNSSYVQAGLIGERMHYLWVKGCGSLENTKQVSCPDFDSQHSKIKYWSEFWC